MMAWQRAPNRGMEFFLFFFCSAPEPNCYHKRIFTDFEFVSVQLPSNLNENEFDYYYTSGSYRLLLPLLLFMIHHHPQMAYHTKRKF